MSRSFGLSLVTALAASIGFAAPADAQRTVLAVARPRDVLLWSLRKTSVAQEEYFADHGRYAASANELRLPLDARVTVRVLLGNQRGWKATATHAEWPGKSCVIFVGPATEIGIPRTDGEGKRPADEETPFCDGADSAAGASE